MVEGANGRKNAHPAGAAEKELLILKPEEALKFWLEEYKVLSSDIQSRVTLQQALLNLQLIFVAAFVALIVGILKDGDIMKFTDELDLCFLTLPIIFSFFVWRHSNHDANIIDKASYIYNVIRPNVEELTGGLKVLDFEKFLENRKKTRKKVFGSFIIVGGEHLFYMIFAALSLLVAFLIFFKSGQFVYARNVREAFLFGAQDVLIVLDVISFVAALHARLKVVEGYQSIVSEKSDAKNSLERTQ
jgi:hypothetical protein